MKKPAAKSPKKAKRKSYGNFAAQCNRFDRFYI